MKKLLTLAVVGVMASSLVVGVNEIPAPTPKDIKMVEIPAPTPKGGDLLTEIPAPTPKSTTIG